MEYISITDIFIVPIYLYIIYSIAFKIRNAYYPKGHKFRGYFILGLTVKLLGAIAICLIYVFYFQTGDTLGYFYTSKIINSSLTSDISTWFRLVSHNSDINNVNDAFYMSIIGEQGYAINNYAVSIVGAILGLLSFNNFLCTSLIIASVAYSGLWALFIAFAGLYPTLIKQSAISALFIPGVAIWGSGLFKDTICMFALGWLILLYVRIVKQGAYNFKNSIFFIIFCSIIFLIKPYIIIAILPLLFIRFLANVTSLIRNIKSKVLFLTFIISVIVISFNYLKSKITENLTEILIENFTQTVSNFSNANLRTSQEENGSGYNLGELDGSINGLISKIPPAINVTLYRPYLWEAGKTMTLLAAFEALLLLIFTLFVIMKARIKIFKYIIMDLDLLTFLLFTFIFSYIVGLTSSNFGTLSRFKIPCMPFFLMSLFVIYDYYKRDNIKKSQMKMN
jgi:hypothetical protein